MLTLLLSKPPTWKIHLEILARELCVSGDGAMGRKKLNRMLKEAMDAGYIWRSPQQSHNPDGSWGEYDYVVGMPDDVAREVAGRDVAASPQRPEAHALEAQSPTEPAYKVLNQSQKEKKYRNFADPALPAAAPSKGVEAIDEFGRAALDRGCRFVFEGSRPYKAWCAYRKANKLLMPVLALARYNGKLRRGTWFESLYPPGEGLNSSVE